MKKLREPVYFLGKEEDYCCVEIDKVFLNPGMYIATGAFASYNGTRDCCHVNHSRG